MVRAPEHVGVIGRHRHVERVAAGVPVLAIDDGGQLDRLGRRHLRQPALDARPFGAARRVARTGSLTGAGTEVMASMT